MIFKKILPKKKPKFIFTVENNDGKNWKTCLFVFFVLEVNSKSTFFGAALYSVAFFQFAYTQSMLTEKN